MMNSQYLLRGLSGLGVAEFLILACTSYLVSAVIMHIADTPGNAWRWRIAMNLVPPVSACVLLLCGAWMIAHGKSDAAMASYRVLGFTMWGIGVGAFLAMKRRRRLRKRVSE